MMAELGLMLQRKYDRLCTLLTGMGDVIIGMSGGVDSVLLAKVAQQVLGEQALAVTADSPSLPRRELQEAVALAERIGIRHMVIKTHEVDDPRYAANPVNRCYFCKTELFTQLDRLAAELGFHWLAYGENYDDRGDHRPGSVAAGEHRVRAPLKEAGFSKADIRELAAYLGLPVWDKPAFACLGSRFPYGAHITPAKLAQVEAAEEMLWELGFRQFRVRHHDDMARIEVLPEEMAELLAYAERIVARFEEIGYKYVTMDLAGYRRGSMNKGVVSVIAIDELMQV
ncbi:MAG: ATP-dependent sacrificial sulfur transferase LarE [Chloroflexota bacterium]